jgi:hypothetical protein
MDLFSRMVVRFAAYSLLVALGPQCACYLHRHLSIPQPSERKELALIRPSLGTLPSAEVQPYSNVTFSPDGGLIASASSEQIHVWDISTTRLRLTLTGAAPTLCGISTAATSGGVSSRFTLTLRTGLSLLTSSCSDASGAIPVSSLVFSTIARSSTMRRCGACCGRASGRVARPFPVQIEGSPPARRGSCRLVVAVSPEFAGGGSSALTRSVRHT